MDAHLEKFSRLADRIFGEAVAVPMGDMALIVKALRFRANASEEVIERAAHKGFLAFDPYAEPYVAENTCIARAVLTALEQGEK